MKHTKEQLATMKQEYLGGDSYWTLSKKYGGFPNEIRRELIATYKNFQKEVSLHRNKRRDKLVKKIIEDTGVTERKAEWIADEFIIKYKNKKYDSKYDFTIEPWDVIFNLTCPYTGLEIDYSGYGKQENNLNFDRINSSIGYVPGNVVTCSWRGNRIKSDGTSEEHRRIANYLDKIKAP